MVVAAVVPLAWPASPSSEDHIASHSEGGRYLELAIAHLLSIEISLDEETSIPLLDSLLGVPRRVALRLRHPGRGIANPPCLAVQ